MQTIYHHLGFVVFWAAVLAGLFFGGIVAWEAKWFFPIKRKLSHLLLVYKLYLTNEKVSWSRTYATLFIKTANYNGWPRWERNMLAEMIKRARKVGFTE